MRLHCFFVWGIALAHREQLDLEKEEQSSFHSHGSATPGFRWAGDTIDPRAKCCCLSQDYLGARRYPVCKAIYWSGPKPTTVWELIGSKRKPSCPRKGSVGNLNFYGFEALEKAQEVQCGYRVIACHVIAPEFDRMFSEAKAYREKLEEAENPSYSEQLDWAKNLAGLVRDLGFIFMRSQKCLGKERVESWQDFGRSLLEQLPEEAVYGARRLMNAYDKRLPVEVYDKVVLLTHYLLQAMARVREERSGELEWPKDKRITSSIKSHSAEEASEDQEPPAPAHESLPMDEEAESVEDSSSGQRPASVHEGQPAEDEQAESVGDDSFGEDYEHVIEYRTHHLPPESLTWDLETESSDTGPGQYDERKYRGSLI